VRSILRILVVGGGGFLGNQIVSAIKVNDHEVASAGRKVHNTSADLSISFDIRIPLTYMNFLGEWKPDVVIQCAWPTEQISYRQTHDNTKYLESTLKFARDCFNNGVKNFIGLGSCAEYGAVTSPCNANRTPVNPTDLYGESKLKTYLALNALTFEFGTTLVWARIFQPYGIGQDSSRLIPNAYNKLITGKTITLENPDTKLDWITSRDVGNAVTHILDRNISGVLDVGTGIGTSVEDLLLTLAHNISVDPKLITRSKEAKIPNESNSLVVSKDAALLLSGWSPTDTIESGLKWALGL